MKLILASDQEKYVALRAELSTLGFAERAKNSAKKFSLFVLLALGAVFIPVLHFVLVPLFLLLALIMAVREWGFRYRLCLSGEHACVQCSRALREVYLLDDNLSLKCEECVSRYFIQKTPGG